jgi:hypothetical protein
MSEVTIGFSGLLRMAIRFHRSIAGGRPIPSGFHGRWSDLVDLSEDDRLVFSVYRREGSDLVDPSEDDRLVFSVYRREGSDLVGASVTLIRFQRHTEDNPYAVVQSVEP